MLDYASVVEHKIAYWAAQPTDRKGTLNSFDGTFAIEDAENIPEVLMEYLMEHFGAKLEKATMADINKALNDVWDGPGSMPKVVGLTWELRCARKVVPEEE